MNNTNKVYENKQEEMLLQMIGEYQNDFYRIAFSYVKNEHDALEVIQESVCKAYCSLEQLKNPSYFKTWFTRILIHKAIDQLAYRKKVMTIGEIPKLEALHMKSTAPNNEYGNVDIHTDLMEAMSLLNEMEQLVVTLRFFDDLSLMEIAQIANRSVNTIKSTLYRSLKKMKSQLEKE